MAARRKLEPTARRRLAPSVASGVLLLLPAVARPAVVYAQGQSSATAAREFMDETGRRVAVPQPVRRIVSLAPSLTETLYALGAQDRLAGVTDYCDYPPEAKTKPKVGGAINPNLEQVLALKPDVVLVTRALNRL
jgi:iron complex transport system substrate-binding protein